MSPPSARNDVIGNVNGTIVDDHFKLNVRICHERRTQSRTTLTQKSHQSKPASTLDSDKSHDSELLKEPPTTSKQWGSTIIIENIQQFLTVEDIQTILVELTDCTGAYVTIKEDQRRYVSLVLPKGADADRICCKLDGQAFLGEPVHAYVVESPPDEQNQPVSTEHQLEGSSVSKVSKIAEGKSSREQLPTGCTKKRNHNKTKEHPSKVIKNSSSHQKLTDEYVCIKREMASETRSAMEIKKLDNSSCEHTMQKPTTRCRRPRSRGKHNAKKQSSDVYTARSKNPTTQQRIASEGMLQTKHSLNPVLCVAESCISDAVNEGSNPATTIHSNTDSEAVGISYSMEQVSDKTDDEPLSKQSLEIGDCLEISAHQHGKSTDSEYSTIETVRTQSSTLCVPLAVDLQSPSHSQSSPREYIHTLPQDDSLQQESSSHGQMQPTDVVFYVDCSTNKDNFGKYMQYMLQSSTFLPEFEVKEVKCDQCEQSSEVTVQFPSLNKAKTVLKQLKMKDPGLKGEIRKAEKPEKSLAEILFIDKLAEFKESIATKSQLFQAKHKEKKQKLTVEHKKQVVPKKCPVDLFQEITARRNVLNQSIVECARQQAEFTNYCTHLFAKLDELERRSRTLSANSEQIEASEKSLSGELSNLRKKFGNECSRFERALPMYAYRSDIVDVIWNRDNQIVILIGETGSGKSTQLVQYLSECGLAEKGTIVCTQPRKVAAISLAKHVSTEMGVALGQILGYKTGLRGHYSDKTRIIYMTDHTLLNECIADPTFSKYSCLIVDEAHERSLSTDLLLAFIKKCLPKRPDLKVIITSATIDPEIFDKYFGGGCPIIKVPGRTYPVEVVWNPLKSDKPPIERNYVSDAVEVACRLHQSEPPGDILVFLTSAAEIEKACQSTTSKLGNAAIVLPLHGKLPPEEQQKVFQQDDQRKIVFATNVAETSVTIPGVKYIVDTGLAKELCFDPKKNMNSLEVRIISKSSAEQRKGRAGRTSAGKCYRLYSEMVYTEMPDKSLPEILRVTLETTALKLHEFGITDILSFDFVEEPDRIALEKAVDSLEFLGAVKHGHLTDLGKKMATLPIDPHLSRVMLDGINWGVGLEAAVSVAISTLAGSVFFRAGTDEMKQESDMKTITFCHPVGDQMTYLHTYFQWASQERANQNKWCVDHFVNAKSMRMVREVVKEFQDILRVKFDILLEDGPFNPDLAEDVLPKLYFDTFIRNICIFLGHERVGYLNNNLPNERLFIFYGSPLRQLNVVPKLLVYEKTLVTTQHFLLQALPVREEWIYEAIQLGKLPCHPSKTSLYQQHCVIPVTVSNLGQYCLKQLQRSQQNLKERVMKIIKPMEPEIDYDYKQGIMKVFVPTYHHDTVSKLLSAHVSELKTELKEELCDKGVTKDDDNVRIVLGCGASIKHVVMPDQYRTIIVKGPSVCTLREEILQALKNFGAAEKVNSKQIKNNYLLFVTFTNPDSASEAVSSLSNHLQLPDDVVVQPHTPYRRPQDSISAFKLQVEWCRRARKTHAFVNFKNEEDFSIAVQRLCIYDHGICGYGLSSMKFRPSKDGKSQLFVYNVNLYLTEDQIKEAVFRQLPEVNNDSFEVKVGYEKSFETTQKELKEMEQELDGLVAPHATNGKYKIFMSQPQNYFKIYKAQIKFDNPDEGYMALKHMQCAYVEGKPLTIKAELSSIVRYSSEVYDAVERSVQEVTGEIYERYKSVKVDHGKKDDRGKIIIRITAEDVNTFIIAKHALSSVILPDVIDCQNPALREFIHTVNCKKALEKIETETSTFIRVDTRRATISMYGNESNRTRAKIEFNKCLSFLDDGTKCFEIRLKEAGKPPGLMKHLVSQFGPGLQQLEEEVGITTVRLDPRRQMITMFATPDGFEFLVGKIDEFTKSFDPSLLLSVHHHKPDEIECCVCFTVITNPSDIFRLEYCGHTYCIDCVKTQVAPSTVEFPVECAADGCSEALVWRDLYNLSDLTGFNTNHMVHASVRSYVAANQDKARNCPTPDCSMIYSVSKDGKCFFCHQCGAIICTTCHEPYHEGVTCAMYQSGKSADKEFEEWLRGDPKNRKRCPKCSSPIEKMFGCNHIPCRQCRAHICWFCLDYFRREDECYDHMHAEHGSFGLAL